MNLSRLPSPISFLPSPFSRLFFYLRSPFSHLLSPVSFLPSPFFRLLSPILFLPSPSSRLLSPFAFLPSPSSRLLSPLLLVLQIPILKYPFFKENCFSLKLFFIFFYFKIDSITLDPDPNSMYRYLVPQRWWLFIFFISLFAANF